MPKILFLSGKALSETKLKFNNHYEEFAPSYGFILKEFNKLSYVRMIMSMIQCSDYLKEVTIVKVIYTYFTCAFGFEEEIAFAYT